MNISAPEIDWSLIRAFLAVAKTGSLSAAAKQLGASQPTLSRHIKELEEQTGLQLFKRQARGFALTETGQSLLPDAEAMSEAYHRVANLAAGQGGLLAGAVRITASEVISHDHLPNILAALRLAEPDIQIELVPSDESRNLLFREADIAIRMYRPRQQELITRHIGDVALGIYASRAYVARKGEPTLATMLEHEFVGYDENPAILDGFRENGMDVGPEFFPVRCDDQKTYWQLVRAGCGIGFSQCTTGDADPVVQRVLNDLPIPPLPIWLTAHPSMHQTPRVRRVWDHLIDGLKPLVA